MKNRSGISFRQFYIMTFGLTIGTSILVVPSGMARTAREDAWIAALCSLAINLIMVVLYIALARLHPGRNIFEIFEDTLGKWLGKAVSLLYLFYFLILTGTLLGDLGFFISSEIMPETPMEVVQIIFLTAAVVSAGKGIIVLARVGELLFPWVLFLFLILTLALTPQIEWNHIKPVLEGGWTPIFKAGYQSAMFQEVIVLMTFLPLVKKPRDGERAFLLGTFAGGVMLSIIVLLSILILGIEQTENSTFPAYALSKTINIANVLQRVEGILITIWVLTFFIKISLLYHSILKGIQTVFRLKSPGHLIYPLAVLFILIAWNTYINTVYVNEIIATVWGNFSFIHLLLIPFILYLITLLTKKRPAARV
ncbi:endospore germination permease [Paenibacillus sp. MMS20-IR301]|uniref:GerAB/ArcD/ProY family transporter n=1 Tax=Paenibacillus sp. MMS20-IR301 TaxID=2895946 RepID=UPI0028EDD4B2|nr:endospore germination permease [Paenibacillus sp. MMS20-IR301]WNS43507.1 endospore germination permease [Paenibacillus sp. MMS20-IR301]